MSNTKLKPFSMKSLEDSMCDDIISDQSYDSLTTETSPVTQMRSTSKEEKSTEIVKHQMNVSAHSLQDNATKNSKLVVEDHPLARRPSTSSASSAEDNLNTIELQGTASSKSGRSRGSSIGRLRDFIGMQDETTDGSEDASYYNSAHALWNNRGKILTSLKKQAADGVRRNLPLSLSHPSGLDNSEQPSASDPQNNLKRQKSDHSGLLKVETNMITESKEDTEVSTFLHGLRDKVVDPLQLLYNKKKDEDEKRKEMEEIAQYESTQKSYSSLPPTEKKENEPSAIQKLSGDLTSKRQSLDDIEVEAIDEDVNDLQTVAKSNEDADICNNNNVKESTPIGNIFTSPAENIANDDPPMKLVLCLVVTVYAYFIMPVPVVMQIIVISFVCGSIITTLFLCVFAAASHRPKPILSTQLNNSVPYEIPKSIYNPDLPIKGWMNEVHWYEAETYHVSNTHSVFVTLDGTTMRLQTPNKSIARRNMYSEGHTPVSNVVSQRLVDITHAKVYLKPDGLVKKRVWSKKYPVVVEIPAKHKETDVDHVNENLEKLPSSHSTSQQDAATIYLFGRTDRQKEEWFYRIQRCINLALIKLKQQQREKEMASLSTSSELSQPPFPYLEDEWGVIENHYEEETFVASTVCGVDKWNNNPLKAYQDYFVHVSRLLPEPSLQVNTTKEEKKKMTEFAEDKCLSTKEPGLEVAWLNVTIGRIMFDFLRQESWAKWLSVKIQKKLDKIKLPYFMEELKLTEMNLGSTVPLVHKISLPKLDSQGLWLDMEVTYTGSLQMTLKTKMVLTKLGKTEATSESHVKSIWQKSSAITDSDAEDSAESSDEDESAVSKIVGQVQTAVSRFDGPQLVKDAVKFVGNEPILPSTGNQTNPTNNPGAPKKWVQFVDSIAKSKYFKRAAENEYIRKKLESVSNTPILLSVELQEMIGILSVNIPPPPTDRIWYGFKEPPHVVIKANPKLGERVVKTSHITDWIEHKLQQEFVKVLVIPNMDDIPIPVMFNNR